MLDPDLVTLRQQAERGDQDAVDRLSSWLASGAISTSCESSQIVAAAMRSTSWWSLLASEEIAASCNALPPTDTRMQSKYLPNSTTIRQTRMWNSARGADHVRHQNAH